MKTYRYKLYTNAKKGELDGQLDRFGVVYNHCIALHRRYYQLTGRTIPCHQLMSHLAKLKKRPRWESVFDGLPSQAVQNVAERIDKAYRLFFRNRRHGVRRTAPPSFKKVGRYSSFTLKQSGYAFCGDTIRIGRKRYGFFKSREMEGRIKTVTVKRDRLGDIYVYVVTDRTESRAIPRSGNSVGYDFGMKRFLTSSDGNDVDAPLFFTKAHKENQRLSRAISRKTKGSSNRRKAVLAKARFMRRIANQRADFHWKLANRLVAQYDVLCFEDLNLRGMAARFGRKIGEYGFYGFLQKLRHLAAVYGREVRFVNRFYPSSKTCHACGWKNERLALRDREWTCPTCGTHHDRDRNAAMNILGGASSSGRGEVRPSPHGEAFAV